MSLPASDTANQDALTAPEPETGSLLPFGESPLN